MGARGAVCVVETLFRSSLIYPQHHMPSNTLKEGAPPPPTASSGNKPKKRCRGNHRESLSAFDLSCILNEAIASQPSAELAVLHLIDRYGTNLSKCQSPNLKIDKPT